MRRLIRGRGRAPLAVAGLLSFPLFFAALMAASLAVERPALSYTTNAAGKVVTHYHDASAGTEAKIWALAIVMPAILQLVGVAAMVWRRGGVYLVCLTAIALAVVLPDRLDEWARRHTARFPQGIDLVQDSDPSDLSSHGEWEANARETAVSLAHWTIGLALGAVALAIALAVLRRRRGARPPRPPVEALTTGGAPQVAAGGESE